VIVVDDRLSLEALAGRLGEVAGDESVVTTWGFHYRLVRALSDEERIGRLTRASSAALRRAAIAPPTGLLQVLDPRPLTETAATMAIRYRLNLLAAELVAAAKYHSATVALAAVNVGRTWPDVLAAEGIRLRVID
jgi:hypothetical protein